MGAKDRSDREADIHCLSGAPKQEHTPGSITIANGKTQMDFAGDFYAGPAESFPPDRRRLSFNLQPGREQ
jgi:hypothetical protein